jgi:general stress protein 26
MNLAPPKQTEPIEIVDEPSIERFKSLISGVHRVMLTSQASDGRLYSRPMIVDGDDFDGSLYFFTDLNSHITDQVLADPKVSISWLNPVTNLHVAASGTARLTRISKEMQEHWKDEYLAWLPNGHLSGRLTMLSVDIEHAEYWDVTSNTLVRLLDRLSEVVGTPVHPEMTHETISKAQIDRSVRLGA